MSTQRSVKARKQSDVLRTRELAGQLRDSILGLSLEAFNLSEDEYLKLRELLTKIVDSGSPVS